MLCRWIHLEGALPFLPKVAILSKTTHRLAQWRSMSSHLETSSLLLTTTETYLHYQWYLAFYPPVARSCAQRGLIHQFKCLTSRDLYIGEPRRVLGTCVKEHFERNQDLLSLLGKHRREAYSADNFKVKCTVLYHEGETVVRKAFDTGITNEIHRWRTETSAFPSSVISCLLTVCDPVYCFAHVFRLSRTRSGIFDHTGRPHSLDPWWPVERVSLRRCERWILPHRCGISS